MLDVGREMQTKGRPRASARFPSPAQTHTCSQSGASSQAAIFSVCRNSGRCSSTWLALGSRRLSPDTTSSRERSTLLASAGIRASKEKAGHQISIFPSPVRHLGGENVVFAPIRAHMARLTHQMHQHVGTQTRNTERPLFTFQSPSGCCFLSESPRRLKKRTK